jgi:hypothetical protein
VIKLDGLDEMQIKVEPWSSVSQSNPAGYVLAYAIKAAADAPEKDREVKVLVEAGNRKGTGRLKVAVKKPEPKQP